ncbi:MAG: hypothetical protein WC525_03685, partial [Candidatus Thermoplasmatota archaeon]
MKRKWLAIGIILLFIGVAIAQSITFNVVKASYDTNFVEVTTQACGIQGYGDTTVKLTGEQYKDLEEYLVEFRAKLNQTSSREEAIPIFKEAVVELDGYGLLPRGMSVERAQKLVTRLYQNQIIMRRLKTLLPHYVFTQEDDGNIFCLIAGRTTHTYFENIGIVFLNRIERTTDNVIFFGLSLYLGIFLTFLCWMNPLAVVNRISLGIDYGPTLASGWVTTFGLLGTKTFQGDMRGSLSMEGTSHCWGGPDG